MSYNDRVEAWATEHSKNLKILYIIWSITLVVVVVGFASGSFDDITFDADKVPVGLMDRQTFEGELTYPTQKDEGRSGLAELDYGEVTQNIVGIPDSPIQGYETKWDCEETEQFGTVEECNEYWDDILEFTKENGRVAMLEKLNDDGHLSDVVKLIIYDLEGIKLP